MAVEDRASQFGGDSRFDDPAFCSRWLAEHGDGSVPDALHRHCVIAIASTYLDGDQNSIPPDDILFAPHVRVGILGSAPELHPAEQIRDNIRSGRTAVIGKIANRTWTVDGPVAFVVYDGFFKSDPSTPHFFVAERFTIDRGLISEIFIAGVKSPATEVP